MSLSRRSFIKTGMLGGGLALGFHLPGRAAQPGTGNDSSVFQPNVFVRIDGTGKVTLTVSRSDMGQGIRTAMAMLVAEELDVAWESVEILQATGDPKFGNQNTDGSRSVRTLYEPMRRAGATARTMLVAAAAKKWSVDASACTTAKGMVHGPGGKKDSYGQLADAAAAETVPEKVALKGSDQFGLIGKGLTLVDAPDIARGKGTYGIDVQLTDMKVAKLLRCPVKGGKLVSFDPEAALAVHGVREVFAIEPSAPPANTFAAVVVLADNTWAAIKGCKAVAASWDEGAWANDSSEALRAAMVKELEGGTPIVHRKEGDIAQAEGDLHEAIYHSPFLAHSPMEPPNATVWFKGDTAEVWAPAQAPQWARGEVAKILGVAPEKITFNVTLLGGGFGRKSKPDFVVEAALIAKGAKHKGPIKLVWTREDEVRFGFYRSQNAQLLRAHLDGKGMPTSWQHRSCFPTIQSTFVPGADQAQPWEMSMSATQVPYQVPNLQVESLPAKTSVRIGWLRSVHHTFHSWAVNCFADELAVKAGKDPLAYQLELIGAPRILETNEQEKKDPYKFDTGRLRTVIGRVREASDWNKRKSGDGVGWGFAAQYSFYSYVAMVAEVAVEGASLKVKKFWVAVDCGQMVNPDTVKAQMEGGVVFALSAAIHGELTVEKGRIQQSNFDNYPMLRMNEAPEVEVILTNSKEKPTGIGEPGVPPVAPALCNAIYAAMGKRIRELPLSRTLT